jgi:hypothetical protein
MNSKDFDYILYPIREKLIPLYKLMLMEKGK